MFLTSALDGRCLRRTVTKEQLAGARLIAEQRQPIAQKRQPYGEQRQPTAQVASALRILPSHGWPAGWIGRRDRALLVVAGLAALPYPVIAALTAGDVSIAGGVASMRSPAGTTTLRFVDDGLLCGPCALARWVHALDLTVAYPDGRVIAAVIARAVPLTADSPHLCHSNNAITEVTSRVPLLPPVDRWGHPRRVQQAASGASSRGHVNQRAEALQSRVERLLDNSDGQALPDA